MSVTHLLPVGSFDETLRHGGMHKFEITADEMPPLDHIPRVRDGVEIPNDIALSTCSGAWSKILKVLNDHACTCVYKRTEPDVYEVTCYIPPPSLRSKNETKNAKKGGQ